MRNKTPIEERMAVFIARVREQAKQNTLGIAALKKECFVTDPYNSGKALEEFGFLKADKKRVGGYAWCWGGVVHMKDVRKYVELVRKKGREYQRERILNKKNKSKESAPKNTKIYAPVPAPVLQQEPAVSVVEFEKLNKAFERINENILKTVAKHERLEKTIAGKNRELTVALSDVATTMKALAKQQERLTEMLDMLSSVVSRSIRGVSVDPKTKFGNGVVVGIE